VTIPETLRHVLRWAMLAFGLHGLWEVVQLPLYALADDSDRGRVVLYLLHCVGGDVLIATTLFLVASAMLRDVAWPARRPWSGGAIVVVVGLIYAGFSEWYNVYQVHAWSYAKSMPCCSG